MSTTKTRGSQKLSFPKHGVTQGAARQLARQIARDTGRDSVSLIEQAQELAARGESSARLVATELAALSFDEQPNDTLMLLESLAADADSSVRVAAAAAASRIAKEHLGRMLDTLTAWRASDAAPVRAAVACAVAAAADPHRLERTPQLVRLVSPLLSDADSGVHRAVSTKALPQLLAAYPEATFEAVVGWSTTSDSRILRNVALAFAGPAAAPLAKRALIVLRKLALDERRAVWRPVATAMWQLGRRRPDVVRPELDRWKDDEVRRKVAAEALRFL